MSEDSLCQSAGPPFAIRVFAQIMTGLHFIEVYFSFFSFYAIDTEQKTQSVGATIILWLCPSLAPEPRIHQYIASTPTHHSNRSLHHHHHHRRHHRDRGLGSADDSENYFAPSTSATDSSDPTTPEEDDKVYTPENAGDTQNLGNKQRATFKGDLPLKAE